MKVNIHSCLIFPLARQHGETTLATAWRQKVHLHVWMVDKKEADDESGIRTPTLSDY